MKRRQSAMTCLLWLAACASSPGAATTPAPVVHEPLVDLHTVLFDFSWRQAITASFVDARGKPGSGHFEAVLQKQGATLTLVGLTSFGTRAFVAKQDGQSVTLEQGDAQRLPFPPRYVFVDINRCFFMNLAAAQPSDGWHDSSFADEGLRDLWRGGKLRERRLRKVNDDQDPGVVITYDPPFEPGGSPGAIHLENRRRHYELDIRTLEAQRL